MNATFRKTMMAGAIAALISAPGWAAGTGADAQGTRSGAQTMERGTTGSPGAAGVGGAQMGAQDASSPLYSMTPQQLRRMDVVDATGEDIGNVRSVVRSRDQENIQLVVSSGGFLGVGGREVAIPLNEVTLVGDKLHLSSSKAELEARPQYQSEQYVELQPSDQPISDFAAFEPVPGQEGQQPGRASDPSSPGMGTTSPGTSSPGTYRDAPAGSGSPGSPGTMDR